MASRSFSFSFRVPLPASAERAYRWATDFRPDDPARMGQDGVRRIEKLAANTLLLTDTVRQGRRSVRKVRLIRLLPRERAWTNTHLEGPYRHSQFLYRIVPVGRARSRLEYTGLQVEHGRPLSGRALARRTLEVRRDDRHGWTLLVRAMRSDLGRRR